jgi:hypothetical protein
MFMTNEQVGIYIRLLCSQHQHGGIIDKVSFNSLVGTHEVVRVKFEETESGFYNIRLMEVMGARNAKSNNLSLAVKKVWEERKNAIPLKSDAIPMQLHKNSKGKAKKTNAIPMELVNENEVIDYFILNGYKKEIAIRAFNYYNEANWHDASGKKVLNWKQKMQSVWFKEENKAKKQETETERKIREFKERGF